MPYELFVDGVVLAEMGSGPSNSGPPMEAAKAQAVAVRSFTASTLGAAPYTSYSFSDTSGVEHYVNYVSAAGVSNNYNITVGQAVTATSSEALFCYNRTFGQVEVARAFFGSEFGDQYTGGTLWPSGFYSNDEIIYDASGTDDANPAAWAMPPYLKSREDPPNLPAVTPFYGGYALGYSQEGAQALANGAEGSSWNYQGILDYYYAVNPPIVRAIDIYDAATTNLLFSAQWDDVSSSQEPCVQINGMNVCGQPDYRSPTTVQYSDLTAGATAIINVTTSESIDTRVDLQVAIGTGTNAVTANGGWLPFSYTQNNFPAWSGAFIVPNVQGANPISISGQGLNISISPSPSGAPVPTASGGLSLQSNPATPTAYSLSTGSCVGYTGGIDGSFNVNVGGGGNYVQSVNLIQKLGPWTGLFYAASWPTTALSSPPSGSLAVATNVPKDNDFGTSVSMTLGFSGPMDMATNPTAIYVLAGGSQFSTTMTGQWLQDDQAQALTWVGFTRPDVIPITYVGPVTFMVNALDASGIPISAVPPGEVPGPNGAYQFTVAGLPYAQSVTISCQGQVVSASYWAPYTGIGYFLSPNVPITTATAACGYGSAHVDIVFSQPMNTSAPVTVAGVFSDGNYKPFPKGTWDSDNETYRVNSLANFTSVSDSGAGVTLNISGAFDAHFRPQNGNPPIVYHMDASGKHWGYYGP